MVYEKLAPVTNGDDNNDVDTDDDVDAKQLHKAMQFFREHITYLRMGIPKFMFMIIGSDSLMIGLKKLASLYPNYNLKWHFYPGEVLGMLRSLFILLSFI